MREYGRSCALGERSFAARPRGRRQQARANPAASAVLARICSLPAPGVLPFQSCCENFSKYCI